MKSRSSPAARSRATGRATRIRPTSPAYDASSPVRSVAAVHERRPRTGQRGEAAVADPQTDDAQSRHRRPRPRGRSPGGSPGPRGPGAAGRSPSYGVVVVGAGSSPWRPLNVPFTISSTRGLEGRDLLVGLGLRLGAGRDLVLLVLGVGGDEGVGDLRQVHALGLGHVGDALAAGQRGAQLVRRHPEGGGRLVEPEALAGHRRVRGRTRRAGRRPAGRPRWRR